MYGLGRIVLVLMALALAAVGVWRYAVRWQPSHTDYPVQGVDVSEANGAIDWKMVAGAGADFAYAAATHGRQRDRAFEANWAAIEGAGLRRGAVHVWSLCVPGDDQADAFNTLVPTDDAALPVAIDVSYSDGCDTRPERKALLDDLTRAAQMIENHMGKPVLLRVSRAVERDYSLSAGLPRPVWAMRNFLSPDYAARPWRMWRASDMRRVDGIEGPANWDVAAK